MKVADEIALLRKMSVGGLLERYAEVFGEQSRSRHREFLIRRIAWRIQAAAEGGLTDRALARAVEIANPADARVTPPRERATPAKSVHPTAPPNRPTDARLPRIGMAITRAYKGRAFNVIVRADGFEYDGVRFRSLSAVAKQITGCHLNGFHFFNLKEKP